ncbi:MAG: hypothetical protein R3F39_25375 [Myxococcota bacterium]
MIDQGLASKAVTLDGATLDVVVAAVRAAGHSCARRADGTAACWAWLSNERNQNGELGSGVIGGSVQLGEASVVLSAAGTPLDGVLRLGGEGSACQVSATLCAIATGGGLYCWGDNPNGAFFAGSADRPWATPMLADAETALSGVDEVAVGFDHICARRGGEVACWGISFSGQIGTGSLGSEDYPVVVSALPAGVSQLIAGARYSCALAAGDVYCWGAIDLVGNGADDDADPGCGGCVRTPVRVLTATGPLTGVARLVGASRSACAITTAGTVYCWGDRSPAAPAGVAALATPVALPTGTTDHMLCQSGTSASTLNYVNPDGSYHVANAELPVVCEP